MSIHFFLILFKHVSIFVFDNFIFEIKTLTLFIIPFSGGYPCEWQEEERRNASFASED